jgi:CrcB protein
VAGVTAVVWTGVLVAGGFGAVLRFLLDGAVGRRMASAFPWGTFVVNLSGAFVLGLLAGIVLPKDAALVVGTGLVGAFTTFSTWMFETHRLVEERQGRVALLNVVGSTAGGLALAALGLWIGGGW